MPPQAQRLAIDADAGARVDFVVYAHALTAVQRGNRLLDGSRSETSAEHSWHLAITAAVLAPRYAPEVDLQDVLLMLAVHDLVEIEVGDVPVYDTAARERIEVAEAAAAQRLFARLPAPECDDLHARWEAFEAGATPAARFARAIDRLQPMLVHWAGDGSAWRDRGVTVAQETGIAAQVRDWWPELGPIADGVVADATARGMLA